MRITDLALLFVLLFFPASIALDLDQRRQSEAQYWKDYYDEAIAVASQDACLVLRNDTVVSHTSKKLNLEGAHQRFLETLYLQFGLMDDTTGQNGLKAYLPLQMVVGYDRLYLHTYEPIYNAMGVAETRELWLPGLPFSYYDARSGLVVNFSLNDYVWIYDTNSGVWDEGIRQTMQTKYPDSIFSSVTFDNLRRQTIVDLVRTSLERYSLRFNDIARAYGKGYTFNIPYISGETWNNAVNDITFLAFLQGMVLPGTGDKLYSTFGFGGTRVVEAEKVYGTVEAGVGSYHHAGCSAVASGYNVVFDSRKDAAKAGYYPCPYCKP